MTNCKEKYNLLGIVKSDQVASAELNAIFWPGFLLERTGLPYDYCNFIDFLRLASFYFVEFHCSFDSFRPLNFVAPNCCYTCMIMTDVNVNAIANEMVRIRGEGKESRESHWLNSTLQLQKCVKLLIVILQLYVLLSRIIALIGNSVAGELSGKIGG